MLKRKILVCVDWYLPAYKGGGPIRSVANLVSQLRDSYELYIFTSAYDLGEDQILPNVSTDTWVALDGVQIYYATSPVAGLKRIAGQIRFDVVYVNSIFAFAFGILPVLYFSHYIAVQPKVIVAPRGMLQAGALQTKAFKKDLFLKAAKLIRLFRHVVWHATDPTEVSNIKTHFGKRAKINQISNLPIRPIISPKSSPKKTGAIRLLYYSLISEKKNLHYLLNLLNELPAHLAVQLDVYGPVKDAAYFKLCQNIHIPAHIKVNYHGAINPMDQSRIFADHDIFVLPTRGENFGHAIFEAMAHALPVLISDQTPWKNLELEKAGWSIPLDNHKAYLDVIAYVAGISEVAYKVYREGSLKYAQTYYLQLNAREDYLRLFS